MCLGSYAVAAKAIQLAVLKVKLLGDNDLHKLHIVQNQVKLVKAKPLEFYQISQRCESSKVLTTSSISQRLFRLENFKYITGSEK